MAIYHLDCSSGIAGDMFLAACLDLGMPLAVIAEAVDSLALRGVGVEQRKASRGGFIGTRFRVLLDGRPIEGPDPEEVAEQGTAEQAHDHSGQHSHHGHGEHSHGPGGEHSHHVDHDHSHGHSGEHSHHGHGEHSHGAGGEHSQLGREEHSHGHSHGHPGGHVHEDGQDHQAHHHQHHHTQTDDHDPRGQRDLAQIRVLLAGSGLRPPVRERALRLFARLGEAEARAHGMPLERVHFHEVGAVDSIVDLVGAAAAIEYLAPDRLTCGPVNLGGGRVQTAHGELPIPTPATAELLHGVPVYGGPGGELTTPTGAVLLAELVDAFVDLPAMVLESSGYGLGRKDLAMHPNVLRLLRGQAAAPRASAAAAEVAVVECEVDDLAGEGFGFLMERLLAAGALDVYFTPLVMKKSRPGTLVSMLCRRPQVEELAGLLLLESGSLGCRYHMAARFEAERDSLEVETAFGRVRIKRGRLAGRTLAMAPEYEDCRRLALATGVPWRTIYHAALAALPAG